MLKSLFKHLIAAAIVVSIVMFIIWLIGQFLDYINAGI